jgi:low temperature requirement protein LtrA
VTDPPAATDAATATDTDADAPVRVTTLELFFDLVFVFTITQLTGVLAHETSVRGGLQVLLMFGVIWWMYGGYVWLTNAVAVDRGERRALLFGGMAAFFIVALAIPHAFASGGPAFGLAYLVVVAIHLGLFAKGTSAGTLRSVLGLAPYNLVTALLVLAGGIAGGTAQYVLWTAAFALEWVTPKLIHGEGFEIGPAHFVERHGSVVLIAIGESVVAVGVGAAGRPLDLELAGVAVLGLGLSALLWWAYFGGDDARAEEALAAAPRERRPQLAIDAFGYWLMLLLLGVIALAAAEKQVIGHPGDPLALAKAVTFAAGVAMFLAGDVLFRRSLAIRQGPFRAVAAVVALATIPLGLVAAVLQLAVLFVLLDATLIVERRAKRTVAVP